MQNKEGRLQLKGKDLDQEEKEKEKMEIGEEGNNNKVDESLPPGFRFHPTDEELITYYLVNKISDSSFTGRAIGDVDLNKSEPWDLPGKAKMGEKEWYFFSRRDRKYPTGMRTNRATNTGYWKTTGKDREIYNNVTSELVGMKKTLVFYRGRAPRGEKSNWVMHEYRIHSKSPFRTTKEEWVVCRVFQKSVGMIKKYPPIAIGSQQHQHQRAMPMAMPTPMMNIPYSLEMQAPNNMGMHDNFQFPLGRNYADLAELTRVLRGPPPPYPNMHVPGGGFTISGLNLNLGGSSAAPQDDHIATSSNNVAMMHGTNALATSGYAETNRSNYNMGMDNCVDLDGYWPSY